jgi:RNA polymerase sigma-70 factor, ECF subfamily
VYEDELTDGYLFRRIRRDDRHAFGVLLRRYEQDLRRLATRLLADADQVDAVMFRAAGKAWRYRGLARVRGFWRAPQGASPADWLYRVVYNACIEDLRRQPRAMAPAPSDGAAVALPEAPVERRLAALRALHPAARVPLVMVDGEGFSVEAASRILQRDPADVAADVERARRQWRDLVVGVPRETTSQSESQGEPPTELVPGERDEDGQGGDVSGSGEEPSESEVAAESQEPSWAADAAQQADVMQPDDTGPSSNDDDALVRATRAALASLPVPAPSRRFWSNLDNALLDEPSLGVGGRPAIRPITQMPGATRPSDDKRLFRRSGRSSRVPSPSPGGTRSRRRVIVAALAVAFVGLLVVVGLMGDAEEDRTLTTGTTAPAEEEPDPEPEEEEESEPETEPTPPPTPPPPAGLESSVPLTPSGVGPLETGAMTLRDVGATVAEPEIDLPTFEGRGGTCYDARLPGAPDLILRVRSTNPAQGVADPLDGILSSITITAEVGSSRETERGIGLGSSEDRLLSTHAGELVSSQNPFVPGGNIYLFRAPDGSGNGIAFVTDGRQVREISVGAADVVRLPDPCG